MNQYFNLYAPINELGYGHFARILIDGFEQLNISNYHLNLIGNIDLENQEEKGKIIQRLSSYAWMRQAPGVALWHEHDLSRFSGNKLIAFPIFETTKLIPIAKHYLSQMDAIFVMSAWARKVLLDQQNLGASAKVFVVPGAVKLDTSEQVMATKKAQAFTFVTIGKYEKRKAPIEIIQAYVKAFAERTADTRLIAHVYNPFDPNFSHNITKVLTSLGLTIVPSSSQSSVVARVKNAIVEVPLGRLSRQQVCQLYRYGHVGLFPARAEGWNLPLMEAIQSGMPCIATDYSAHTEYLNSTYDYPEELLLKKLTMVPAQDGVYFKGDRGNWADFSVDDLSHKMKEVFDNYTTLLNKFNPEKIITEFTPKNSAVKFMKSLEEVLHAS